MMKLNELSFLFDDYVKIADKVSIQIPKVEQVARESNYSMYLRVMTLTTRELFSSLREVDEYEDKYPNVWQMVFDKEGDMIFGQMLGNKSGLDIIIDTLSYWTGLKSSSFKALSNKKMINEDASWVIDEQVFEEVRQIIIKMTGYEPNEDLVAPRNMSERQFGVWEKLYKGRIRKLSKGGGSTFADKIIILQISMDSYIPLDEIRKMTIYHFNKLYEGLQFKEAYLSQREMLLSPKFESKQNGNPKHWRESFNKK